MLSFDLRKAPLIWSHGRERGSSLVFKTLYLWWLREFLVMLGESHFFFFWAFSLWRRKLEVLLLVYYYSLVLSLLNRSDVVCVWHTLQFISVTLIISWLISCRLRKFPWKIIRVFLRKDLQWILASNITPLSKCFNFNHSFAAFDISIYALMFTCRQFKACLWIGQVSQFLLKPLLLLPLLKPVENRHWVIVS